MYFVKAFKKTKGQIHKITLKPIWCDFESN